MQDFVPKLRKSQKIERQTKALVRRNGLGVTLLVMALFVIIGNEFRYQPIVDLRAAMVDVSRPILQISTYPLATLEEFYHNTRYLILGLGENIRLRQNAQQLMGWQVRAKVLELENQQLRALVNANAFGVPTYVSARIIGGRNASYSHSLLINVGNLGGVQISDAVINMHGLIGQVIEVSDSTARVLLLDDLNSHVPVSIHPSGQEALVSGMQGRALQLQYINGDGSVIDGAHLFTNGVGGVFPPGLPVGAVRVVDNADYQVLPFAARGDMSFLQVLVNQDTR